MKIQLTVFAQLLKQLSLSQFDHLVDIHRAIHSASVSLRKRTWSVYFTHNSKSNEKSELFRAITEQQCLKSQIPS